MYQFTHIMTDMQAGVKKTYCWRGLAAGLLGGWLPAWGLTHWQSWGGWAFAGIWLACLPTGYYLGKLLKKK